MVPSALNKHGAARFSVLTRNLTSVCIQRSVLGVQHLSNPVTRQLLANVEQVVITASRAGLRQLRVNNCARVAPVVKVYYAFKCLCVNCLVVLVAFSLHGTTPRYASGGELFDYIVASGRVQEPEVLKGRA